MDNHPSEICTHKNSIRGRGCTEQIEKRMFLNFSKEGANVAVVDMNAENAESTAQQLRCRTAVCLASHDSDYTTASKRCGFMTKSAC